MRALYSYAAVQLWADAVNRAGSAELQAVAFGLRAHELDTILRTVGFEAKGDVTGSEPFTWYI
jgi:branched-chain amino acid transport system substrate-binding protein